MLQNWYSLECENTQGDYKLISEMYRNKEKKLKSLNNAGSLNSTQI